MAFFNGNGAPGQVWAFIVAPIVGAVIAGWTFEAITGIDRSNLDVGGDGQPRRGHDRADRPPKRG